MAFCWPFFVVGWCDKGHLLVASQWVHLLHIIKGLIHCYTVVGAFIIVPVFELAQHAHYAFHQLLSFFTFLLMCYNEWESRY